MYWTAIPTAAALVMTIIMVQPAYAAGDHEGGHDVKTTLETMREEHAIHEHAHDFEMMAALSPEDMELLHGAMLNIGLTMPPMDTQRGRELFLAQGCIACHQVNGIGGDIGPSLNATDMPAPMNAFEFAARMWRGADAMIQMQKDLFGEQISLSGQDLADLVAFAHDEVEQQKLSDADIPEKFREFIGN
jgi:mono/diheme cytochrome c family protein